MKPKNQKPEAAAPEETETENPAPAAPPGISGEALARLKHDAEIGEAYRVSMNGLHKRDPKLFDAVLRTVEGEEVDWSGFVRTSEKTESLEDESSERFDAKTFSESLKKDIAESVAKQIGEHIRPIQEAHAANAREREITEARSEFGGEVEKLWQDKAVPYLKLNPRASSLSISDVLRLATDKDRNAAAEKKAEDRIRAFAERTVRRPVLPPRSGGPASRSEKGTPADGERKPQTLRGAIRMAAREVVDEHAYKSLMDEHIAARGQEAAEKE